MRSPTVITAEFRISVEELRYAIEATNTRFASLIAREFAAETSASFRGQVYAAMYPEIFTMSPVEYVASNLDDALDFGAE